jgi:hypothetical protein
MAQRFRHAQAVAVPQLAQPQRLGLEHVHVRGAVELDEIGFPAVVQPHGLVDATATHRAQRHRCTLLAGNFRKAVADCFPH